METTKKAAEAALFVISFLRLGLLDHRSEAADEAGNVRQIRGQDHSVALLGELAELFQIVFRNAQVRRLRTARLFHLVGDGGKN